MSPAVTKSLVKMGWWQGQPLTCTKSGPRIKYYFVHDNLQTMTLGELFREHDWAICTIDHFEGSEHAAAPAPLSASRPPLKDLHANQQHWAGLESVKARVISIHTYIHT